MESYYYFEGWLSSWHKYIYNMYAIVRPTQQTQYLCTRTQYTLHMHSGHKLYGLGRHYDFKE